MKADAAIVNAGVNNLCAMKSKKPDVHVHGKQIGID